MPLSQAVIAKYWAAGDAANTSHDKGKHLEELVRYLFEQLPGVKFYKSNIVNIAHSEEIDVAFFNSKVSRGLPFLEFLLLVECKNWSQAVGAQQIREFTTKLKHRSCANGVLVAASGITGNAADRTAAHDAVRMALAVEKIRIIVITRAEIETWTNSSQVIELIKLKLCELTVDGSIFL